MIRQCPFQDCHKLDLSVVGKEFFGIPMQKLCQSYGVTGQQLLVLLFSVFW
jgi:hypothetical protein